FSLAGGTGLALRLGHRLSYVIDLFSYEKFDVNQLDTELESYYGYSYLKKGTLSNALFSNVHSVKSDFIYDYTKKIKEVEKIDFIRIYPLEENIAMKMNAICGRGRKRDFYDLYFILKHFSFNEVCNFFSEKYGNEKLILFFKSVVYFDDAEKDEEPVLLKEKITWKQVKRSILKNVNIKL
ncbi:MAG TPA: nucleotidyl transferase AbiEii/AbiGii toxin family protein, partial [Segetibacter sp.]